MAEPLSANAPETPEVPVQLHALAQLLRNADHLDPKAQQAVADLVDELGNALAQTAVPSAEVFHLTESTAQLAQALYQEAPPGTVASARNRVQEAIARAESGAAVAAGLAQRLVEALSNIGI